VAAVEVTWAPAVAAPDEPPSPLALLRPLVVEAGAVASQPTVVMPGYAKEVKSGHAAGESQAKA
jgi:hypothetical protein